MGTKHHACPTYSKFLRCYLLKLQRSILHYDTAMHVDCARTISRYWWSYFEAMQPATAGGNRGTSSYNPMRTKPFEHYIDKIPGDWQKKLSFTKDMKRSASKNQPTRNYRCQMRSSRMHYTVSFYSLIHYYYSEYCVPTIFVLHAATLMVAAMAEQLNQCSFQERDGQWTVVSANSEGWELCV